MGLLIWKRSLPSSRPLTVSRGRSQVNLAENLLWRELEQCSVLRTQSFSQGTTDGAGNLQPIEGTRQRAYDVFKVIVQNSYCCALF